MHALLPAILLLLPALPGRSALAASTESDSKPAMSAPANADYADGKRAIEAGNWQAAIDAFSRVVAGDAGNANAHNFLGYAYRRSGKLDLAFKHYEDALRLDPKHRGAREYAGEAYLMVDNLAKAEEQLRELDRLCLFGCEEYDDLKQAVAEYKRKNAGR
jgi:Flp pilus assembly protein TadD